MSRGLVKLAKNFTWATYMSKPMFEKSNFDDCVHEYKLCTLHYLQ